MTRILQPTNPTQFPVLPGAQVITQVPMATAVAVGDYVYMTPSGYGLAASSIGLAVSNTYLNATAVQTYLQTATPIAGSQYGPVLTQATYTGTTYTLGGAVGTLTAVNSASTTNATCGTFALSNGNFVTYYTATSSSTVAFRIVSPTGATVAGPTTIATNVATSTQRPISGCPLASGGFVFVYAPSSGTTMTFQKYAADGTLSSTASFNNGYTTVSSAAYVAVCELTDGSFAVTVFPTSNVYICTLSSAGVVTSTTTLSSFGGGGALCPRTGGGFSVVKSSNTNTLNVFHYASSGAVIGSGSANITCQVLSLPTSYGICPSTDDGIYIVLPSVSSTQITFQKVSSSYSVSAAVNVGTSNNFSSTVSAGPSIFLGANNALVCTYPTSGAIVASYSSNSGATWSTPVTINAATPSQYTQVNMSACNPQGVVGLMVNQVTTNYAAFLSFSTLSYTNGQTVSGPLFTPPQYYFIGVAANAASIGDVANVVVNGQATLNSNYPSLATTANFDFSGFGQFGNAGSVFGRTVSLKGLQ